MHVQEQEQLPVLAPRFWAERFELVALAAVTLIDCKAIRQQVFGQCASVATPAIKLPRAMAHKVGTAKPLVWHVKNITY
jgi:hypothetical protein